MKPFIPLLAPLVFVVGLGSTAHADIAKKCKDATYVFSQTAGCVKRPPAPKATPAETYLLGLDALEADPKKGFKLFEAGCTAKHGPSCTQLGLLYQSGRGRVVSKDKVKAATHFERGCDLGDGAGCQRRGLEAMTSVDYPVARRWFDRGCTKDEGIACAHLAFMTDRGLGGPANAVAAKPLYEKAHRILAARCPGNGFACYIRGYLHEKGLGVKVDMTKAVADYRLSCAESYGDGCMQLAYAIEKSKAPLAEVITTYEKACEYERADGCSRAASRLTNSDPKSLRPLALAERGCALDTKECGMLAEIYRLGRGVKADQDKATGIYKSACDAGDQWWCVTYAKRVHDGIGVKADVAAATRLVETACREDEGKGCEQLAIYLSNTKTDDAKAFTHARKGCDLNAAHSCFVAGWMIRSARDGGAKRSPEDAGKDALVFAEKGCEKGSPDACNSAGELFRAGTGVEKDAKKAFDRFTKACDDDTPLGTACLTMSIMLAVGEGGIDKDKKAAIKAAGRGCNYDQINACEWLPKAAGNEPEMIKAAVDELAQSCKTGKDAVCYWQALVLAGGATDDKRRAIDILSASCGRKHLLSCTRHADAIYFGVGVKEDKDRGDQLYRQACDDGEGTACLQLAVNARAPAGTKDASVTLRFADRACKLKIADGCNEAGYVYYTAQKPVRWDVGEAATYYAKGCELGSSLACANQGELWRFGINGPADAKKSFALYTKSCDAGSPDGCSGAAYFIARGEGGAPKDLKKAIEIYRKSCDLDVGDACKGLADLLEAGKLGTPTETARLRLKALNLTEKLAESNPAYMYWLGTYHRDGMATMKDPAKALAWFEKACDGFDPLGCIAAGKTLAGSASPTDQDKARVYFQRACAAGVDDGCTGLQSVGKSATPAKPTGPTAVGKPKGCACGGEVAPGGEAGLVAFVVAMGILHPRGRRRRR